VNLSSQRLTAVAVPSTVFRRIEPVHMANDERKDGGHRPGFTIRDMIEPVPVPTLRPAACFRGCLYLGPLLELGQPAWRWLTDRTNSICAVLSRSYVVITRG
jgi:hypothetical protein